jgi:hypothetical protein
MIKIKELLMTSWQIKTKLHYLLLKHKLGISIFLTLGIQYKIAKLYIK